MVNYASERNFGCVFHGPSVGLVRERKPTKTLERTQLQNLVRHKSGRYYARAFAAGKGVWKSLQDITFQRSSSKLAEFLKEYRQRVSNGNDEVSAKMTFCRCLRDPSMQPRRQLEDQTAHAPLLATTPCRAHQKLAETE